METPSLIRLRMWNLQNSEHGTLNSQGERKSIFYIKLHEEVKRLYNEKEVD